MALASPWMDMGLEPYAPAGTSGVLVTQVRKASCQALLSGAGPALWPAAPPCSAALPSALPTKTSPPVPQSQNQSLAGRRKPGAFL